VWRWSGVAACGGEGIEAELAEPVADGGRRWRDAGGRPFEPGEELIEEIHCRLSQRRKVASAKACAITPTPRITQSVRVSRFSGCCGPNWTLPICRSPFMR